MANEAFLGLSRPNDTTVRNVNLPSNKTVTEIWISNTSAASATFQLYYDNRAIPTFNEFRALFYNVEIKSGESLHYEGRLPLGSGSIAVQSSVASALTFTFFGEDKV